MRAILWAIGLLGIILSMPVESVAFQDAIHSSMKLVSWYAHRYTFTTILPAFLLAGLIVVFFDSQLIRRALGAGAKRLVAYSVAAVGGAVSSVCSCAVLPIFAGITRLGAGVGPATTFLFAGPAINVLALVFTAQILGAELAAARTIGAIIGAVLIGLAMAFIFRESERETFKRQIADQQTHELREQSAASKRSRVAMVLFVLLIALTSCLNWARSGDVRALVLCCPTGEATFHIDGDILEEADAYIVIKDVQDQEVYLDKSQVVSINDKGDHTIQNAIHSWRWWAVGICLLATLLVIVRNFDRQSLQRWGSETWLFSKKLLIPLVTGVAIVGFLIGTPTSAGIIPDAAIEVFVGASPAMMLDLYLLQGTAPGAFLEMIWPVASCFFAALAGMVMYFATLTEVPIVEGLLFSGMGKGPALALLLAGPAVSLPNLLVIGSVLGLKRTAAYITLVLLVSTSFGLFYGMMA